MYQVHLSRKERPVRRALKPTVEHKRCVDLVQSQYRSHQDVQSRSTREISRHAARSLWIIVTYS